ncbi:hypothetical protein B296_00018769 [Ensete ventricosum]|uniref:Cyclin-dependent kinase inhibitor domain-containing protein n=1 Tax=Ensete ventricosum TaxID=4639 RepID=A0A426Z2K5_ENSVE|nr:hypothetical protein B296_00018769 [Ensete ventricosum]
MVSRLAPTSVPGTPGPPGAWSPVDSRCGCPPTTTSRIAPLLKAQAKLRHDYASNPRAVDELAVMEVTQVVGARTRARTLALASAAAAVAGPKRKSTGAPPPQVVQASSYLQLRSRRLVMMTPRKTQRPANSSASSNPDPTVERVSRCSSNASSEVVFNEQASRKQMPPSNEAQCEAGDLESMTEARSSWRRAEATPTQAEMEEFFAAAEREQAQQFADNLMMLNNFPVPFRRRYNYDVVHDVPFDGRFEWVRSN